MHILELDSYNLSDTVKFHDRLNPRLWDSAEHLRPDVADKLMEIARDFQEFMGVPDLDVVDITISGSNAAYNYTGSSDIDLHLVINVPKVAHDEVYRELFNAKKYEYNDIHNIRIGGADVELYAQDSEQPHHSQGIYSLLKQDWISVPRRRRSTIDDVSTRSKYEDLAARIDSTIKTQDRERMISLMDKIKTMRRTGLEKEGEFGSDNLAFKLLRNNGYIKRLIDARNAARDAELSLAELARPRRAVTYGFTTESPDGVNPTTKMFLENEPADHETTVQEFIAHVIDRLGIDPVPEIVLHSDPDWSKQNHSFGRYNADTHALEVNLADRHVMDILRTVAHELVHCRQNQQRPLPDHAGQTGSAWENDANARAGVIMRDYAESNPEKFTESASGYIPKNKKEARDPRFSMALTQDIGPGQVGKEANKLGLKTDANGKPALLMKSANTLAESLARELELFEEQDLFEINMGGKNLRKEAAKTGALAGMEFEMIVPNTQSEDEGGDLEPDYDSDERASSPRDIRDFFYDGDYNTRRSVDSLIDSMMNDFSDWQSEEFGTRWESDSEQMIYDYIKENMDDDDVRGLLGLESEDPISREEYQLAADKITAEQIEPWYEDAQESAREEFYEDDDQFEEWLSESELAYMSDIERRYSGDITWPHYRSVSNRGEGASVQETAESFSQAVGRPARASDSYHAYGQERPAPGKNFYVVEPDGSLEPDDPDDAGLEFVSPPLPIDQIMSDLNKVKKWADLNGCYTNSSTGLHINISVPNYDLDKLDFVKLALLMGDEYVLEQFGRVSNTYARSAMKKVRDHVQNRPYEAKYLLDKMKGHMGELASKAIHSGITDKYTSINTKDGHVEFRSPGGDWLGDNFSMIENTLLRFTVALSAAMDPKAYREEYLKKLYKTLAPKDEKDPLSIFAKYAAGELPADALKSFVRQVQADRKAKKSGEDIVNGIRWRVSLKPELGGGVVEVMATDPIDAKKQAIRQQPNWRFVDDDAITIERLDEPAAGVSTTGPHPQGRGRPNDPTGRLAIVNKDDPRNYGDRVGSEAPDYLFRFTLADGYSQAQLRAVKAAWAARENVNADDYIIVDTTQFAAPEQTAAPEAGSVQWNIINRNNETVHTFWNRNVQRDANTAAHQWLQANYELPLVDGQGPFDVVPAAIPGSTLDLQRQRQDADSAANSRRWADYEASQSRPTPIPGVEDIDIDIPIAQPRGFWNGQWKIVDGNTGEELYRFGGIGNSQVDANRIAGEWVRTNSISVPTEVYPVQSDGSDTNEQVVNELKINNATGVGAVPYNREIDYHGLRVTMRPSMFLRLALPLDQNDPEERKAIEYCKSQLDDQGIGAPFLTITVPEAWESDDFSLEAKVRDHDGRHRCYAILGKEGDEPIEVHLMMSGGLRRRHISDNMIKNLRNGILNQQGQYVSGPIFDTAQ